MNLTPFAAKKKFSKDIFKYNEDHTYNFDDIEIKFNENEYCVDLGIIKRNIVFYDDIDIIGQDFNNIKDNFSRYKEYLGEDNIRNIKITKDTNYGEREEDFSFIINDKNIITRVKILRND